MLTRCPKCGGRVVTDPEASYWLQDKHYCLNCGWRPVRELEPGEGGGPTGSRRDPLPGGVREVAGRRLKGGTRSAPLTR